MTMLEALWGVFGPADLGPVDFSALERRTTPNDALVCPKGVSEAKIDQVAPVFKTGVVGLRAAMAKVVSQEPRTTLVGHSDRLLTERYVERSAVLKFPDTIVVAYIEMPEGATVAMYSRSQLGYSDLGANLSRLRRWIDKLTLYVGEAD